MALEIDTDHGVYDVLAVREHDGAPDAATHTVIHDDGSVAGFASDSAAWDLSGTPIASLSSLAANAAEVAESDRDAALAAWPFPRCGLDECDCADYASE